MRMSVWMASDLDAPVTAAAAAQSVDVKSTAADGGSRDEGRVGPEERLYLGLGVACDSCGLFGQPTGASLLAVSTMPAPPVCLALHFAQAAAPQLDLGRTKLQFSAG